jgi:hypothetical protein
VVEGPLTSPARPSAKARMRVKALCDLRQRPPSFDFLN